MFGWALRASSKLLFFSTRTSSSSAISARLTRASVQSSKNFSIVAVEYSSWQRGESCRRVWCRVDCEIALGLGLFFFSFWVVSGWESSWYFVSTATNVALYVGTGGVSCSAHAHLSGRKQFVLNCDWTTAVCTWKWKRGAPSTHWHAYTSSLIIHTEPGKLHAKHDFRYTIKAFRLCRSRAPVYLFYVI